MEVLSSLSYWCANNHSHAAKWETKNCFHWWSMNPNEESCTKRHIAKGDTCRCHSDPPLSLYTLRLCVCLQVELLTEVPWQSCSDGACGGGCYEGKGRGGDSWSMIRWILIHSFIHEIQWVSCLLRDSTPNALASFIITLCIICKEEINCFHLIQIRKGGTKESNITAERKHDHGETSGFASVAYINGVTQFLVCFCW